VARRRVSLLTRHPSCVQEDAFRLQTTEPFPEVDMTSSQTYLLGFIILIIGLAGAAYILAVPTVWIAVGVVIFIGIGIMAAASYSGSGDR
jgi:hypothetical protein